MSLHHRDGSVGFHRSVSDRLCSRRAEFSQFGRSKRQFLAIFSGDIVLTVLGIESAVRNALSTTPEVIDSNATLSAGGQDIVARIGSGALVTGAVAGSVATVIPEPSVALLMMDLGLVGLRVSGWAGRAERQMRT